MADFEEIQEIELLTEEDIKDLPVLDAEKAYLKEISRIPIPTREEVYELGIRSMQGDLEARKKLAEGHLRLVASIARRFIIRAKHLSLLDLIQYGNLGLLRSIESYNPNLGALSTYAVSEIERYIKSNIANYDATIREPVYVHDAKNKYRVLTRNLPKDQIDDEEIRKQLNVSEETYNYIKESISKTITSLNKRVENDDDKSELMDFVASSNGDVDNIIDQIDEFELLIAIKETLNPTSYFILITHTFNDNCTLDSLGDIFYITKERVRQLEEKAKRKVAHIVEKDSRVRAKIVAKTKAREGKLFYKLRVEPIPPNDVILYSFLKGVCNDTERKILYELLLGKYNFTNEELRNYLQLDYTVFYDSMKHIRGLTNDVANNKSLFIYYGDNLRKTHRTRIYELNLGKEYINIDYMSIAEKFNNMSYDEFMNLYGDKVQNLSICNQKQIKRFFGIPYMYQQGRRFIETDINILLYNYKIPNTSLNSIKLLKTYNKTKGSYTLEEQLFIESYILGIRKKSEFLDKYPNSYLRGFRATMIQSIEKSYFDLQRLFLNSEFTKERWLDILNKHKDKFTDLRINIMNMHLGVNCEPKTIEEICNELNISYKKVHTELQKTRSLTLNLEMNTMVKNYFDKAIYEQYLLDPNVLLKPINRNVTKMYLLEGKSYEEIGKIINKTKSQVSNIVTDTIRRIDFYRFGIIEEEHISEHELKEFFSNTNIVFTKLEQNIIIDRFSNNVDFEELREKYQVDKKYLDRCFRRFDISYKKYITKDVKLSANDYIVETNKHLCESCLTENEMIIVSYRLGIKNKYNKTGEILSNIDLGLKLGINNIGTSKFFQSATLKVKLLKIGKKPETYAFISRKEINDILKDPHLPITEKEREVICYIFELNGYPFKRPSELNELFNDPKFNYYRCWQRAYVTIQRYLHHEIEGTINIDTDINPYLKYFCNTDRIYIIEHYKNHLSYEQFAKKYNISYYKVLSIAYRVKDYLQEIWKNPKQKRFNFIFAETALTDRYLPYDGDLKLMSLVFKELFTYNQMERLSFPEIIKKHNLPYNEKELNNGIINLMLAICKLEEGIKKNNTFTEEEVIDYYNRHKDELSKMQLLSYQSYFKRINSGKNKKNKYYINDSILFDLITEKYPDYFCVSRATREQVLGIIEKYGKQLNKSVKLSLMNMFDIKERDYMSGAQLHSIYRTFDYLERTKENNNPILLELKNSDEDD